MPPNEMPGYAPPPPGSIPADLLMSVTAVTSSRPASEAAAVMFPRSFRRSSRARDRAVTLQGNKGDEVTSAAGGAARVQAIPVTGAPTPASPSSVDRGTGSSA